ncbi:Rpr2-domain-containing protein [Polyplosphaeria fusca]|uniref:Rpr2-domain-containing protein n=1 Tax=Polyplosphaeria fusca TaxID=682080 RepID=A0A9P4R8S7_9PLEO|nr:Rpr2-domain-containing protein [Polyplosphaeria fusca]
MATDKKGKGVANKHLHARTTFLYQAATYLTLQARRHEPSCAKPQATTSQQVEASRHDSSSHAPPGLALQLASHLRSVSRKGQLHLSTDLKRSLCKTCNTVLIPGHSSTQSIQNNSKGNKKPWADVLVIECHTCGSRKILPVGAKRQRKKSQRRQDISAVTPLHTDPMTTPLATTPASHTVTEQSKPPG